MAIELNDGGAALELKATLDTADIQKKWKDLLNGLKTESDKFWEGVKKNPSGSGPKLPEFDANAAKTIQGAMVALGQLEEKAQESAYRLAELRSRVTELSQAKAELKRQLAAGTLSTEQYNKALGAIEIQQRQAAISLKALNKDIQQSIQLENVAAGSLEEGRIKLAQYNAEIVKMGGAMDGSNKEVNEMIAKQQELYKQVSAMEQKMGTYGRNVGNYASGWNGMQNSINQMTRELPAFTYSVQTGFMALSNNIPIFVDELNKAASANKALTAEGKKGVPVWKQLVSGLFSWQTALSIGITLLTVSGKEIGEWVKALFKGKDALAELKKANQDFNATRLEGTKSAQGELTSLKTLYRAATDNKLSYNERLKAVKQLQQQYPEYFKKMDTEAILAGKATNAYGQLSKSILATAQARAYENKITEISTKMLENNDAILEKRNSVSKRDRSKMQFEDDLIKNGGMVTSASTWGSGTSAPRKALADADIMEKANKKLSKQINRYESEIDKLIKTNGVSIITGDYGDGKAPKISTSELNEYKSLVDKIADIDKEYARKFMDSNEAEIQSVRDKFAEIKKEIQEYNSKNPKIKINTTVIDQIEQRAVKETEFKQGTDELVMDLEEQKRIYDLYNAYGKEVGEKAAKEHFSDQLSIVENFRSNLEAEYLKASTLEETTMLSGFKGTTAKLTLAQKERVDELGKMKKAAKDQDEQMAKQEFADALSLASTYDDDVLKLQQEYQQKLKVLGSKATEEQKAQLKKRYDEEISSLTNVNLQKQVEWEKVFNSLQFYSKKATDKVLDDIQTRLDAELKAGKLTKQDYDQLTNELNSAKTQNNIDKSWIASKSALDNYRKSLKEYGKESDETKKAQSGMFSALSRDLADASGLIGDLSGMLDSLGASSGLQDTIQKIGSLTDGLSGVAAGIASGNPIAVISGSIKVLTAVIDIFNTKDKKIQKQLDRYQEQLSSLESSFSKIDKQLNDSVGESIYANSELAIKNLREQQRLMSQMARAEEQKKKSDKSKVQGYKDGISQIDDEIAAIEKSMKEMRVGTDIKQLSQSISDALISAFEEGADAIEATDKVFDKFIKNALANSLKLKYIEPIIKGLINDLDSFMEANDNNLAGFNFEGYKTQVNEAGKMIGSMLENLYGGLGLKKESESNTRGLEGSISRAITESSSSEQLGIIGVKIKNI